MIFRLFSYPLEFQIIPSLNFELWQLPGYFRANLNLNLRNFTTFFRTILDMYFTSTINQNWVYLLNLSLVTKKELACKGKKSFNVKNSSPPPRFLKSKPPSVSCFNFLNRRSNSIWDVLIWIFREFARMNVYQNFRG